MGFEPVLVITRLTRPPPLHVLASSEATVAEHPEDEEPEPLVLGAPVVVEGVAAEPVVVVEVLGAVEPVVADIPVVAAIHASVTDASAPPTMNPEPVHDWPAGIADVRT